MFRWVYPLGGEQETVVFECRSCGTTLDSELAVCPYCGPAAGVVRYDIE